MAFYHNFFTGTVRDPLALTAAVRVACGDATAGVATVDIAQIVVKKATDWTTPQVSATQTAIDGCPQLTSQRQAQNEIDNWPISMKAFALALVDQINVLRVAAGMQAVTPAQALAAIRSKAGTL